MNTVLNNFKGKVSIVIPVYNIAEYIEKCVESVTTQSYQNLEIILVDDGSTDESPILCDNLAKTDARIRVIHQKNGGLSVARNEGLAVATGDYVVFVDGDDYLTPISVEQLLVAVLTQDCPIGVGCFTSDAADLDTVVLEDSFSLGARESIREILTERQFFTCAWGKIYRRDLFETILFPAGLIYEDYAVVGRLFDAAKKVAFTGAKLYYYRYTPTGITKSSFKKKHMDYFTVTDRVGEFIGQKYPELRADFERYTVRNAIAFFKKMSESGYDDFEDVKKVRSYVKKYFGRFFFGKYPLFKKMYGLLILWAPKLALKVFNR